MKDAQKPDHRNLEAIITWLRDGYFVVPDFQREFEWKPWDIRELIKSIFLDYYIGNLLLWKGKKENFEALSCEPIYGYKGEGRSEYIVLDGQQRLTALYYAFLAPEEPLPNRTKRAIYFIHVDKFMSEEYDEAFSYEWFSGRLESLLSDREAQFSEHLFPVCVVGEKGWALPNWVQDYERYWVNKAAEADSEPQAQLYAENAKAFGDHLQGIIHQYQVSYIELDQDLTVDKVCDIFTQINSRGIRLDVFDLMNALLKPKGLKLKHLWRKAATRLEFVESEKLNVYILQVMSILRQAYCSPKYLYFLLPGQEKSIRDPDGTRRKEVLVPNIEDFEKRWNVAVTALEQAIKHLRQPQQFGVSSAKYLPYVSILPAFAALQAYAKTRPSDNQLDAERKLRHWYWASVFTNRYSGSVESTSTRDYLDVKAWLEDDTAEPALIQEFKNRFKALELRKETKRGSSVYNGIFNLLVIQGAKDWITGYIPQPDDLDDHHIIPASWGNTHVDGKLIHSILNRTPLTADTNRKVIGDKLPNEYLPELIAKNGEKMVRSILETHFISATALEILLRNPFTPEDFEAFIAERQRTLQDAIENLLIKERLDLSPNLRELDTAVEATELALRRLVQSSISKHQDLLPPHVIQKVNERIQREAKKNAALKMEDYQTLQGKLEYFDLRELQDTITSKSLWPYFQDRFVNKEMLTAKFGQLAELRNGIRHSRAVDEITKKEGEAALIWFKQLLEKPNYEVVSVLS